MRVANSPPIVGRRTLEVVGWGLFRKAWVGWLTGSALWVALTAGCAGEVLTQAELDAENGAGAGSPGNACALCDPLVDCSMCFIQGQAGTYRCPPGSPLPGGGCTDLFEVHTDPRGYAYTCYYCK